ncbi:MAG: formylglycine-generating enzyme family protein, partial [Candidatus Poribacteria bacterium]
MNRIFWTLILCVIILFSSSVVYARDVEVIYNGLSDIDMVEGTAIINYTLIRNQLEISPDQPIWIFVKYRLAAESDYLDWKDTDDLDYTNDDSDGRFTENNGSQNGVSNTVNKNLQWDVGIVGSGGDKEILWTWGGSGTGVPSDEMVRIPGGEITFGVKVSPSTWNPLTGGTATINDFYMTKYPVTTEMYAEFLNRCANRHDPFADADHDFYYKPGMNGGRYCRLKKISGSIDTQDAVFAPATGRISYDSFAMTSATWYNAYDFAKWAGLRMITGEEFEYEATNRGNWYFPWGDSVPDTRRNRRANMKGVRPNSASDVYSYDESASRLRKPGLSVNGVAELAGNIWKWCFTVWYQGDYDASKSSETVAEYGPRLRVIRGGAYLYEEYRLRGAGRSL